MFACEDNDPLFAGVSSHARRPVLRTATGKYQRVQVPTLQQQASWLGGDVLLESTSAPPGTNVPCNNGRLGCAGTALKSTSARRETCTLQQRAAWLCREASLSRTNASRCKVHCNKVCLGGQGTRCLLKKQILAGEGGRAPWSVLAGGGRPVRSTSEYSPVGWPRSMKRLGGRETRCIPYQRIFVGEGYRRIFAVRHGPSWRTGDALSAQS